MFNVKKTHPQWSSSSDTPKLATPRNRLTMKLINQCILQKFTYNAYNKSLDCHVLHYQTNLHWYGDPLKRDALVYDCNAYPANASNNHTHAFHQCCRKMTKFSFHPRFISMTYRLPIRPNTRGDCCLLLQCSPIFSNAGSTEIHTCVRCSVC